MSKRFNLVVLILAILSPLLIVEAPETAAQPTQFNITNIEPNTLYPGTVFAVNGGQYIEDNSVIYFGQGTALETYFESANRLVAIVPLESNLCGEQGIIVKTEVNINNAPAQIDSNFVVKVINCPNSNNITPAAPEIDDITVLDVINGSGAAIRLRGENFIPSSVSNLFSVNNASPQTEVRVYNDDYEYEGPGDYQSFGRMDFEFPNGVYCGTYTVSVQNRFPSFPSSPTTSSQIDINGGCIANGNGDGQGGYEVMNLDLPSTAYVDEQIQGSVQVRNRSNDTFYGRYLNSEMELYVNGELRDTQELDMDPDETSTFPLSFNFDRPGMFEIEIRVGDSYQSQTIDVQSENGTGPPPPTQGGDTLADYDMDGDCVLGDTEFFVTTDAWISESISDLLFFSAVDAWIGQSNICTAAASSQSFKLVMSVYGMQLSTSAGDSLGAVKIYDSNGREVFSQNTSSNRLFWNMRDQSNQRVANGVYWVRVGASGEVKMFVVMR